MLAHVPVGDYASVNAIEVADDSEYRDVISAVSSKLILHFSDGFQGRKVISFMRKRKCESQRVQLQPNAITSRGLFKNVTRGVSAVRGPDPPLPP
jgi:hypothetical protein